MTMDQEEKAPGRLLRGTLVRLTALTPDDLPTIAGWYENTEFLRLFDSRPAYPQTEKEIGRWLEEMQKSTNDFPFGIRRLDNDELIGYVEIDGVAWTHQVGGMGLGIGDPANWGKGYGHEATQLALEFAFQELNLHRVVVTVYSYNQRSMALCKKLGFRREGVYREHLLRDGQRYDMHVFGLLRREWEAYTGSKGEGISSRAGQEVG